MSADVVAALTLIAAGVAVPIGTALWIRAGRGPQPPQPPAVIRPRYRCNASTGRAACTAPATRMVMIVTGPTEMRTMCEQDAMRECRIGRAVDLGPISGGR
jgi:hypothetical protein